MDYDDYEQYDEWDINRAELGRLRALLSRRHELSEEQLVDIQASCRSMFRSMRKGVGGGEHTINELHQCLVQAENELKRRGVTR